MTLIDYSTRCPKGMPYEMLFKVYLKTLRDKMTLLYDPAYSKPEILKRLTDRGGQNGIYCPDYFLTGLNLFDFLDQVESTSFGELHTIGYTSLLLVVATHLGGIYLKGDIFPEGGEPVRLDNMKQALERFPEVNGDPFDTNSLDIHDLLFCRGGYFDGGPHNSIYFQPNLDGTLLYTHGMLQIFPWMENALNRSCCYYIREGRNPDSSYCRDQEGYYKRTDIYATTVEKYYEDGVLKNIYRTEVEGMDGVSDELYFGYRERAKRDSEGNVIKDENGDPVYEEYPLESEVTFKIHSKSPFLYKYAVCVGVFFGNALDVFELAKKNCPYDFYVQPGEKPNGKYHMNVIHEEQEWVTGDQTVHFKFSPGPFNGDYWEVRVYMFHALIYADLPDRLAEALGETL